MSQIMANNIGKRYGNFDALTDISLEIEKGEFLTFLGPSGSGKTTFLMILAGFTQPTSGQLFKAGTNINNMQAEDRNFGMVFQGYALFPHMSVWQNVDFPLRVRKIANDERKKLVGRIIDIVDLSQHVNKKPSQLSGGQQQRVALARSLVFQPDMLLLDEPLSALDRNLRAQMQDELKRIHGETGTTFVFVTHDQSEALAMSDNIAIFNQGQLMQKDRPDTIYNRPNSRFVAEFLGRINIFPITDVGRDGQYLHGRMSGVLLSAVAPEEGRDRPIQSIAVRPEHMFLSVGQPAGNQNSLMAEVQTCTYQGSHSDMQLKTENGHVISVSSYNSSLQAIPNIGDRIGVTWKPEDTIVLND